MIIIDRPEEHTFQILQSIRIKTHSFFQQVNVNSEPSLLFVNQSVKMIRFRPISKLNLLVPTFNIKLKIYACLQSTEEPTLPCNGTLVDLIAANKKIFDITTFKDDIISPALISFGNGTGWAPTYPGDYLRYNFDSDTKIMSFDLAEDSNVDMFELELVTVTGFSSIKTLNSMKFLLPDNLKNLAVLKLKPLSKNDDLKPYSIKVKLLACLEIKTETTTSPPKIGKFLLNFRLVISSF